MDTKNLQKMLGDAASVILQQKERIDTIEKDNKSLMSKQAGLEKRISHYERKEECEKIASLMIDKGLADPSEYRTRVQELYDGDRDLAIVKQAAEMYVSGDKEGIEFVSSGGNTMAKTADERAIERFNTMS